MIKHGRLVLGVIFTASEDAVNMVEMVTKNELS